jgi:hypothetical protein
MLALYVVNFGPFDERRAMHWLLANSPNVTAPLRIG